MENAAFITTEEGKDLIVSFAIPVDEYEDVKSLTLLRTPKYEFIMDESERGVRVFFDDSPDDEYELLEQVVIEGDVVTITTNYRSYTVSIRDVESKEIEKSRRILKKMNFDRRFEIKML